MRGFYARSHSLFHGIRAIVLAIVMVLGTLLSLFSNTMQTVKAAGTTITSMEYYSAKDGPIISGSGVGTASYGFVMPIFNGGAVTWNDVASDLTVNVKVNGNWVNIDDVSTFTYNVNWGNWTDSGFNGYWFKVAETTYLQLVSKSTGVTLDYTLNFTNIETTTITSMTATQGPVLTAGATGSIGFTYPIFNGDASIPYAAVASDMKIYVKDVTSTEWINIDNNAESGWIYDKNFGQFTDGGGGLWFTIDKSINVKLQSTTSGASIIYTLNYEKPVRNSFVITPYSETQFTADKSGAIGIPLPKIDGGAATKDELDNFVYEVKVNGAWVELADFSKSSFSYSGNGYNKMSDKNQWGYWVDHIYGLWFQPVQQNMELRIGYPLNGEKGGSIGTNYVNYTFIGNPDAPRPDMSDMGSIELGTSDDSEIDGQTLIFSDEFNGSALDTRVWNYNTGYYINDDPGTWGWGNNELEYYTDSTKNIFLKDGNLNLVAYEEPKSFPQDPNRYAQYSSGKITTKDKFAFTYGRIDFRAKLPKGNGIWPALWMLPNDDTYGTWAASGEIDVMEARGRLPQSTCGTIHYGGQWPANTYTGADYAFPSGQSIDSDFHVYSCVWEEDVMKWYVDGVCFSRLTSDQWYSAGASNDPNAPFDQQFYVIMNLAVGGWFDGGVTPNIGDIPATMQVDYVRVYKPEGSVVDPTVKTTGVTLDKSDVTLTTLEETTSIAKTIEPSNASNKNVTWTSSNPEVAKVSGGQVTAVADGVTIITATTVDGGYSATCKVTVRTKPSAVDVAAGKKIIASSEENAAFVAGNMVDGNLTTRWSSAFSDDTSFVIDLEKNYNISQFIFNWEAAYAKQYEIFVSKDGKKYTSVKKQTASSGGVENIDITPVDARYVKFQGIERATPYGYSLWDLKIMGSESTTVEEVYSLISTGKNTITTSTENNSMVGSAAVDGNAETRWSSEFDNNQSITIDLGYVTKVNKVILNWEAAFGKNYSIQISEDGMTWKSVADVTDGDGKLDELTFDAANARFVKMQGIERGTSYGYSLFEMEVYGIAK